MPIRLPVRPTLHRLLEQEDTDGDGRITVRDAGPRAFAVPGLGGVGVTVRGVYPLSNLHDRLDRAREAGRETLTLDPDALDEHPVRRTARLIRDRYWDALTRWIDAEGLARILRDPKRDAVSTRLYVPATDPEAYRYYRDVARVAPGLGLKVLRLPESITPAYVKSLDDRPGLLSLALREDDAGFYEGVPFVVPGGRFNELFGWDSYFIVLGLLADGLVALARDVVDNFVYEITHYGQILNANRTYFLTRSQPPFLTAMALAVYARLPGDADRRLDPKAWLHTALEAAMREYETVWTTGPHLTPTGLSRYHDSGIGRPPEPRAGHYDALVAPLARAAGFESRAYLAVYATGRLADPALDRFFEHDRALRESGHDTSYRLVGRAADLNTVDLNALLYRYETDLADAVARRFDDRFVRNDGRVETSAVWRDRAAKRQARMQALMWDAARGFFFDYDYVRGTQTGYESATAFYPLWAGLATPAQAEALVERALPLLERPGGVAATSEASRGPLSAEHVQLQWDYPFGWAPHQMLVWAGLARYGYADAARRLAGRWLRMLTVCARDFSGVLAEKYDVAAFTHEAYAEYGNVGTTFTALPREGFGWTNASYQVGLQTLDADGRAALEEDTAPPDRK